MTPDGPFEALEQRRAGHHCIGRHLLEQCKDLADCDLHCHRITLDLQRVGADELLKLANRTRRGHRRQWVEQTFRGRTSATMAATLDRMRQLLEDIDVLEKCIEDTLDAKPSSVR